MPVAALRHGTRNLVSSIASNKLALYAALSVFATAGCIVNGARNHSNFYSVMIYLSRSSASVLIFANFGLLLALFCGHLAQLIFFGPLRTVEIERLYDRTWYFVTESLLSFTIFRDEFDMSFAIMFCFLIFVKAFHWLASDRIEWMDQRPYPGPPLLFHIRMAALFTVLWVTDFVMLSIAVESNMSNGVSCMVLFACEYGVLFSSYFNITSKYLLSLYDFYRASLRGGENAPPWEAKSVLTFYIELVTDFLKLATYSVFFVVIMMFYGVPLNIIRDVFMTGRSFFMRIRALHRYRTATRNMDQRYPDASPEELDAMSDRTCIICREDMVPQQPANERNPNAAEGPNQTPKKLPCGHIFHFYCLRSWLERQQSCPTCRRTVLETRPQLHTQQPDGAARPNNQPGNAAAGGGGAPGNAAGQGNVNQRINNNFNNAARFMGGLFGGPRPANAPAAPGPAPTQAPRAQNNANVQHLPAGGVVVQYHIHYGPGQPAGQAIASPTAAPQPLREVPPFEGFAGPGGAWQPWPTAGQAANDDTRSPTAPTSDTQPPVAGTSASGATSSSPEEGAELSAREAARAAFLRRMNGEAASGVASSSESPHAESSTAGTSRAPLEVPLLVPVSEDVGIQRRPLPRRVPESTRMMELPTRMTDDDLSRMDRLTREAIDERLRVLENVSQTVYQCADELLRLRSALPAVPTRTSPAPSPQFAQAGDESASTGPDQAGGSGGS